jgi:hypothetical protein
MGGAATRWWPWLSAPVSVLVAWLAVQEQRRLGRSVPFLVSVAVPGLLLVAAGLFMWSWRPANRCWWMLVAAGLATFIGDFQHAGNADIALAGFAASE